MKIDHSFKMFGKGWKEDIWLCHLCIFVCPAGILIFKSNILYGSMPWHSSVPGLAHCGYQLEYTLKCGYHASVHVTAPLYCHVSEPNPGHKMREGVMRSPTCTPGDKFYAEILFHCLAFIMPYIGKPSMSLHGPHLILFCSIFKKKSYP